MISDAVIDALVASGATAEMIAAAVKASRSNAMSNAERQARYRAKQKQAVTEVTQRNVTEHNGVTTKGFPLSPIPLLSPTPPNNPLTPKPLSKNSFGAKDFGDWPADYRTQFWAKWPHKVGKPVAMRALDASRKRGVSWVALLGGIERYMRTKPPDRAWMNPATFLNGDRHEDQPAGTNDAKPGSNNRTDFGAGRATSNEARSVAAMGIGAINGLGQQARILPFAERERTPLPVARIAAPRRDTEGGD